VTAGAQNWARPEPRPVVRVPVVRIPVVRAPVVGVRAGKVELVVRALAMSVQVADGAAFRRWRRNASRVGNRGRGGPSCARQ
jgi:hypothetical protein